MVFDAVGRGFDSLAVIPSLSPHPIGVGAYCGWSLRHLKDVFELHHSLAKDRVPVGSSLIPPMSSTVDPDYEDILPRALHWHEIFPSVDPHMALEDFSMMPYISLKRF